MAVLLGLREEETDQSTINAVLAPQHFRLNLSYIVQACDSLARRFRGGQHITSAIRTKADAAIVVHQLDGPIVLILETVLAQS